jgi:NADH:ubiquinone oxidoreductase subunit 3 (subunit A)
MSIITLIIFVPILAAVILAINWLFSPSLADAEKISAYECGIPITAQGLTRAPFSIQYYIVCLLFLVLDLEIAILYPLSVVLYQVSIYGYWISIIFLILLTIGFIYELASGALYFTDHRSTIIPSSRDIN